MSSIRAAFPGTTIWWGHQTRTWWAALPGAIGVNGLVDAPSPGELCQLLAAVYPDFRGTAPRGGDHAW
jgi:hypothetical protein